MFSRRRILGFFAGILGSAEEKRPAERASGGPIVVIKQIFFDPTKLTLKWEASVRARREDEVVYKLYTINYAENAMAEGEETRFFSKKESDIMVQILLELTKYAVISAIWWVDGGGAVIPERHLPRFDVNQA